MKSFFQVVSVARLKELCREFPSLASETVSLLDADGRVLAKDLIAGHDLPLTHRSCMDGYAVRAQDLFGAGETSPAYLNCVAELGIDLVPDFSLEPGQCAAIVTGGCLPDGADAVIMVEHTQELGAGDIEMRKSVAPGENVMLRGEDAEQGKAALAKGLVIRPQEVGLLAALGFEELEVGARPRVGILSTGDELVEVNATPRPGQVRDVNTWTLAALCRRAGALPDPLGLVPDQEEPLRRSLEQALQANDVVLLSGGSSVGVRDLTLDVIQAMAGAEILVHGVAVSPGKPLILARVGEKSVWGLPGQVSSALVTGMVLVVPFLRWLMGDEQAFARDPFPVLKARLMRNTPSKPGREDYVRVRLERGPEGIIAEPVLGKSGLLGSMLRAQGLMRIAAESEGLKAGQDVDVLLFPGAGA